MRCSIEETGTLDSCRSSQFHLRNRLIVNTSLYTEVMNIEVHVVILQLVEDIERSIVCRIVLSWVEDTRGIRSVGVGVDIEVALDLTAYDVYILTERTRRTLVTIGGTPDDIQREASSGGDV